MLFLPEFFSYLRPPSSLSSFNHSTQSLFFFPVSISLHIELFGFQSPCLQLWSTLANLLSLCSAPIICYFVSPLSSAPAPLYSHPIYCSSYTLIRSAHMLRFAFAPICTLLGLGLTQFGIISLLRSALVFLLSLGPYNFSFKNNVPLGSISPSYQYNLNMDFIVIIIN